MAVLSSVLTPTTTSTSTYAMQRKINNRDLPSMNHNSTSSGHGCSTSSSSSSCRHGAPFPDVGNGGGRHNGCHTTTTSYHPSKNGDVDYYGDEKKKYFATRSRSGYSRKQRLRQTVYLFVCSVCVLLITYAIVGGSGRSSVHKDEADDQFHQKRSHHTKWKRDPALREERRRKAQGREDANREFNQRQQQLAERQQSDRGRVGGGNGMFESFFHSSSASISKQRLKLKQQLEDLDRRIWNNENRGTRWINMQLIPSLEKDNPSLVDDVTRRRGRGGDDGPPRQMKQKKDSKEFFRTKRRNVKEPMEWEKHDLDTLDMEPRKDYVDYTKHQYEYPPKLMEPPATLGDYPKLMPLKELMEIWPQDELDHPPTPIYEDLIHFDYTNPDDMVAATKFRDAKLPFKVVNVPEVVAASSKWTDEYIAGNFDSSFSYHGVPASEGTAQESPDNYFAWFLAQVWDVDTMGVPPTRNNDWTFNKWAQHARYADRVGLHPNQPHFYWQSGVDRGERYKDERDWTFVSRDLPSFSSTEENFFLFEPEYQKGIQCRFGERGVTAATHFDGGRNMVAMVTGAKRYILSPPRECGKLGIVTARNNPIFRHSLLNFGHLNHMDDPNMPKEERAWLELAGTAQAISTVLKAGEVLYIPSHWFHYITSVQKSAQCNVRSGIDRDGDSVFGGWDDVTKKCSPVEAL